MRSQLPQMALLLLLSLASCTTPSHLVFHQTAVIGADVSANTTTGQVNLSVGYDRQTSALVPKTTTTVDVANGTGEENEAMSALAASKVAIKGIGTYEVNEQFATGKAAVNLARKRGAVKALSTLTEVSKEGAEEHP